MESFDEASLLAELGEDGDDDFESHEEVEARLMRELAAMPDAHAEEETALLASIHGMQDEPDEGDLLMAQLLREEKERQDAMNARRAANAANAARVRKATSSSRTTPSMLADDEAATLRAECTAAKHEAVRLKRAGDMEGARNALRRSKELQARADAAAAAAAAAGTTTAQCQLPSRPQQPKGKNPQDALAAALRALGDSDKMEDYHDGGDDIIEEGINDDGVVPEELRDEFAALGDGEAGEEKHPLPPPPPPTLDADQLRKAIAGAKREAVMNKRAGDMDQARAALKLSKELQAKLDTLLAAGTLHPDPLPPPPPPPLPEFASASASASASDPTPRQEDLDEMVAAAIGAVVDVISEDPNSRANVPHYDGAEQDDEALIAAELGDEYVDDELVANEEEDPAADLDERRMLEERIAELELAVLESKKTAVGRKRAGDVEGAKVALRNAKAHQAELEETRAMIL